MSLDADRLNWSLRHGAVGDYANGVFKELADACREICDEHFPAEAGYEVTPTRVSGPIEGITLTVERLGFRAQISVQRYLRLRGVTERDSSAHEIRVVAAGRLYPTSLCRIEPNSSVVTKVTAATAAALGLSVIALSAAGLLSTWSQAVLMLPVLLGLRMYWAGRIAANLRRKTAEATALPAAGNEVQAACAELSDMERWRAALSELEAERETLAERFTLRPFRTIPTAPALTSAEHVAPLRSVG